MKGMHRTLSKVTIGVGNKPKAEIDKFEGRYKMWKQMENSGVGQTCV